ncbi:MAG: hypothetical protein DI535_03465 [Citrobacter freundii]|nr:MAG: hypothetical protein DI535_03465 [Citrobacter freundii]
MHLFIDTNIFEQDPYWKNSYAQILLAQAQQKKIKLYLSEIVYEELRLHTARNHKKTARELGSARIEHNKFLPKNSEPIASSDPTLEFEAFYDLLETDYYLTRLGYEKISFEKVMDRVLKREKPFNDDKTEVKDCGIWLTYAEYAESRKLAHCYLLTNNKKDFYEKSPLSENPTEYKIHAQLERDSRKFRGFPSIKDFLQLIIEPKIKASEKFQAWLDKTRINNVFIIDVLKRTMGNEIENKINRFVDRLEIMNVYDEQEWPFVGEIQLNELDWYDCQEIEKVTLEDSAVVSAVLNFTLTVEGHAYNPSHDDENSKYYSLGEKNIEVDVFVSFTLKTEAVVETFDITDIELRS